MSIISSPSPLTLYKLSGWMKDSPVPIGTNSCSQLFSKLCHPSLTSRAKFHAIYGDLCLTFEEEMLGLCFIWIKDLKRAWLMTRAKGFLYFSINRKFYQAVVLCASHHFQQSYRGSDIGLSNLKQYELVLACLQLERYSLEPASLVLIPLDHQNNFKKRKSWERCHM